MAVKEHPHVQSIRKMIVEGSRGAASKECAILVFGGAIPDLKACARGRDIMQGRLKSDYKISPRALDISEEFSRLDCESFEKGDLFSCVTGVHAVRKSVEASRDIQTPEYLKALMSGKKRRR